MKLTAAQAQAIGARGNVLVVAGAGTGKTRTLVERCLSCLIEEDPPVSLDQILMVTFTEAAATEMRQRIRSRLEDALRNDPSNMRWHEQLALFDTAHIGTLHSFCLQLIRPHFYELELDPQISVMAEEEARLLAEETLTNVLGGYYSGQAPAARAVQQLIQVQGGGSELKIRDLVFRLHYYSQTLPNPAEWFEDQMAVFSRHEPAQWQDWLLRAFTDWRQESLLFLEESGDRKSPSSANQSVQPRKPNHIAERCASALRAIPPGASRAMIAVVLEQVIAICEECPRQKRTQWLKDLEEFQAEAQFLLSLASTQGEVDPLNEDWGWVRVQMKALLELTREFGHSYTENKRELGMLDFHDLEQYALHLLWDHRNARPTETARQWRKKLRYIFVDEYQDINSAQDRIIEALSGEGAAANRFLVGDVKQSIYRFRLANPSIFKEYAKSWHGKLGQTVPLVDNFRSAETILNFINSLFTRVMDSQTGGVRYDEQARLCFGSSGDRKHLSAEADTIPRVELHVRVKGAEEPSVDETAPDSPGTHLLELEESAKEARIVALRLSELKAQHHPIWDEERKRFRPMEWSDVGILLRSPINKAESYAKEFSRQGIPLLVQRSGFYDSIEISDLLNLFHILDNPLQDVPVLAVLHSPLAGLTINELAAIRLSGKGPFWTALVLWANSRGTASGFSRQEAAGRNEYDGAQSPPLHAPHSTLHPSQFEAEAFRKVATFLERFTRWRRLARQTSLSRCLQTVLDETHYDTWLLAQTRGGQRHANVKRLLRLVQQFDTFQRQGLFRFLCFIEAQKRAETEPEVRAINQENAVRLMSIHQSKGLEFPVVVVADLAKPFNLADLSGTIILDELYGLCPQVKPPHTGKRYPSLPYWLARRRQKRELLGEELRLLYVAMTRARDTLLLSASITRGTLEKIWNRRDKSKAISAARSFADWLGIWIAENCAPAFAVSGENSLLRWSIHDETRLLDNVAVPDKGPTDAPLDEAPEKLLELQQRLAWQYPFLTATRSQAKASVTELRSRAIAQIEDDVFQTPVLRDGPRGSSMSSSFRPRLRRDGAAPSAAEIGNAHHSFLQLVSLQNVATASAIQQEADRLQLEGALAAEQVSMLNLDALAAFWNSELGQRIRAQSKFVKRELAFTARFSAETLGALLGESPQPALQNEFVLVQGVADLVVLMPRELWLVDFKTDAINRDDLGARVQLYEPQMKLYARALAQIYSRPVTDCWLYFLDCQVPVPISLG
jgi:ATP-dependent helicase/nuclease subunit A